MFGFKSIVLLMILGILFQSVQEARLGVIGVNRKPALKHQLCFLTVVVHINMLDITLRRGSQRIL